MPIAFIVSYKSYKYQNWYKVGNILQKSSVRIQLVIGSNLPSLCLKPTYELFQCVKRETLFLAYNTVLSAQNTVYCNVPTERHLRETFYNYGSKMHVGTSVVLNAVLCSTTFTYEYQLISLADEKTYGKLRHEWTKYL